MWVTGKPIDQVTEADIHRLIEDKHSESKTLDYKACMPSVEGDRGKHEFRRDVTSLANAEGGILLFGVKDDNGIPTDLIGIKDKAKEQAKLELEELFQTCIKPRIPAHRIQAVDLKDGGLAIIVYVPKSFMGPHQVQVNKDDFQFWARNASGKYRMDVDNLRLAFGLSEGISERIVKFREERIQRIRENRFHPAYVEGGKVILHVAPVVSFASPTSYDLSSFALDPRAAMRIEGRDLSRFMHTFQGYAGCSVRENQQRKLVATERFEILRKGATEFVDAWSLRPNMEVPTGVQLYCDFLVEGAIRSALGASVGNLCHLGLPPPYYIFVSLLGLRDRRIKTTTWPDYSDPCPEEDLILPEQLVHDPTVPVDTILKPMFDMVWNAFGQPRSLNYTEDGTWKPRA